MFIILCVEGGIYHSAHVEVRGQPVGDSSFFPPFVSWALNLGHESWWQMPLTIEPYHQPLWN